MAPSVCVDVWMSLFTFSNFTCCFSTLFDSFQKLAMHAFLVDYLKMHQIGNMLSNFSLYQNIFVLHSSTYTKLLKLVVQKINWFLDWLDLLKFSGLTCWNSYTLLSFLRLFFAKLSDPNLSYFHTLPMIVCKLPTLSFKKGALARFLEHFV